MNQLFETKEELEFPVSYYLRVIMANDRSDLENRKVLEDIFCQLDIPFSSWEVSYSGKKSYIRYSVNITVEEQETMNELYVRLSKEQAVKFAL